MASKFDRAKAKRAKPDPWRTLTKLISNYAAWARADEMKGGGDPTDIPQIEASLELARANLNAHIERLRRGDFT